MASLKFIRKRISSVKNTQKITKAMKMVSAAKLRRAMEKAQASRPYEKELRSMIDSAQATFEWQSELGELRPTQRTAIVVISSDRGLCGSLNANIFKKLQSFINSNKDLGDLEFYCLGKKARDFVGKRGMKVVASHLDLARNSGFSLIQKIADELIQKFIRKEIDRVEIFFSEFRSALVQEPKNFRLLPFELEAAVDVGKIEQFIFRPEAPALLESLVPMYIQFQVYRAVLESVASEHAARMASMDAATTNAKEMIGKLTLEMNRARQAAITKELMEIIGGAEAISA
jgi:F-type H+-transporting ATPase subunit gamma